MDIEDDLTRLAGDTRLKLEVPARLDRQAYLQNIAGRLHHEECPPTVLWNLRPWNNFTFLHAVYCERLRYLQSLGFHPIVILYDNVIAKLRRLPGIRDPEVTTSVRNVRRWLLAAGIQEAKSEIFLESDIWRIYAGQSFLDPITSFAHSSEIASSQTSPISVSTVVDNLFELVYESFLQVDFVLTGGRDVQDIWNTLRLQTLDQKLFPEYKPPCVISFPSITNSAGQPANTKQDELSVFTTPTLRAVIRKSDRAFLRNLFDFFLIPRERSGTVVVDGNRIDCFRMADELFGDTVGPLMAYAEEQMSVYFATIAGTGE